MGSKHGKLVGSHRRYTESEQAQAARLVRQAHAEGRGHGAVARVAAQLGYGAESARL